jgi:type I restriction-modification system DNA methylase subunit
MNYQEYIQKIKEHTYMSKITRDKDRVKSRGEIFTPDELVCEILDQLPKDQFTDYSKTFLDPACGDGQFLVWVVAYKLQAGSDLETALKTTYGVDIMPDNVKICQDRLLAGNEQYRYIVEKNIGCFDGLKYHYRFDDSGYDPEPVKKAKKK